MLAFLVQQKQPLVLLSVPLRGTAHDVLELPVKVGNGIVAYDVAHF